MALDRQAGFWGDYIFGDTQSKLRDMYQSDPSTISSDKFTIINFWDNYGNLQGILNDRFYTFKEWFLSKSCVSPETITRSLRALKEDGTIPVSDSKRQYQEQTHRQYFGNQSCVANGGGVQ